MSSSIAPRANGHISWNHGETSGDSVRLEMDGSSRVSCPSGRSYSITGKSWGCLAIESLSDLPKEGLLAILLRDEEGNYGVALYEREKAAEFADYLFENRLRVMCNLSDGATVEKVFLEDHLTIDELTEYRLHGTLPEHAQMKYHR